MSSSRTARSTSPRLGLRTRRRPRIRICGPVVRTIVIRVDVCAAGASNHQMPMHIVDYRFREEPARDAGLIDTSTMRNCAWLNARTAAIVHGYNSTRSTRSR